MGSDAQHEGVDLSDLPAAPPEDKELALAFQRGEKGAYQAIHDRYAARVYGVCRRMLISREDAAEASQETFLRVYQSLGRFNGRYLLAPWITRIATNVCLDALRAKNRRPSDAAVMEVENLELVDSAEHNPEAIVLRRTEGRRVRKVLSEMPPLHRAAIVLRDFEGLSYQDIAIALGISEPQVKALLHRARTKFKASWQSVGLAGLLPARLATRLRRVDAGTSHGPAINSASQIAEAASPIAQVASSCSMALQQCGQFVSERFATAVVGAVVAGAAIGAAGSPPVPDAVSPPAETKLIESREQRDEVRKHKRVPEEKIPVAAAPASDEVPAPDPEPTPAAEPSPAPAPSSAPPEETGGEDDPTPQPAPPTVGLAWDTGQPVPLNNPSSYQGTVDCETPSISQQLTTTIAYGDKSYPAQLSLSVDGGAYLEMSVTKDGTTYTYNGGAASTQQQGTGKDRQLRFTGSYGFVGSPPPGDAGLPSSGSFRGTLTLDCEASRVITESITFSKG